MSLLTLKNRLDRVTTEDRNGRFIVVASSTQSENELGRFLSDSGINPDATDTVVTIKRFAETGKSNPELLSIQDPIKTTTGRHG